jgi:GMP synthase (glutamine-hydrolysing)
VSQPASRQAAGPGPASEITPRTAHRPFVVVQHLAPEGPGLIAEIAAEHTIALDVRRMDRGDALPPARTAGGVVVLGGPMGVYEADAHPHLVAEQRLLADACTLGLPVLGVCLGAQLLAAALGARVFRGPAPEIGFGTVTLTGEGVRDRVLGPSGPSFSVFHWHGDTFDLPAGATLLASSGAYAHQAFRAGERAYGLQFHVELHRALARDWADALPAGVSIEETACAAVERNGRAILGRFFEAVEG